MGRLDSKRLSLRVRSALALGSALALAGCLITSDFDGIVGARPPGGSAEGSTPPPAVVPPGSVTEAGSTASPCDEPHLVCTSFDDATLPAGWGNGAKSGGSIVLDPTIALSPPNALLTTLTSGNDGGAGQPSATLLRDVSLGSFQKLTLTFDMRIVDCPAQLSNSLTFLFLRLGDDYGIGLVNLSSGTLAVGTHAEDGDKFVDLSPQVSPNTWTTISIEVVPTDTALTLRASVNGRSAALKEDGRLQPFTSTAQIGLGPTGAASPNGCKVAFDNVYADKE